MGFHFGRFMTGGLTFLLLAIAIAGFVLALMPELLGDALGTGEAP